MILIFAQATVMDHEDGHDDHDHDDHDHDHGELCTCRAEELGITIDCANTDAMSNALKTLQEMACQQGTNCKTKPECDKAFILLRTHHDYCLHAQVPDDVSKELHDYEGACSECTIAKQFDSSLPMCDAPTCSDAAAIKEAHDYLELASNGCATDCAQSECGAKFRVLRAAHDLCDVNDLPQEVEEGIHDFEDACAAQDCNAHAKDDEILECHEHEHDDEHEHDESAAIYTTPVSIVLLSLAHFAMQ